MVAIIIDVVLVAFIALFTFIGYKQGLVKAAIKILSFFIAIIIAFVLYKPVSNFLIKNTNIDEKIKGIMVENVKLDEKEETSDSNIVKQNLSNKIIAGTNDTIEEVSNSFTVKIIEIGVIIALYIIARIALIFVTKLADLITKIPGIKQINAFGGIIYGFIKGVLLVYIILGIIYLVSPMIKSNTFKEIDNTIITKEIYNNNVLLKLVF